MRRTPALLTALALLAGCRHAERQAAPARTAARGVPAPSAGTATKTLPSGSAALKPAASAAPARDAAAAPIPPAEFARLFRTLSGPDRAFFSDNYISNETSYLQVAPQLEKRAAPGRAYLGVGPEQNFTYIALTRPELAFIVDIRRDNALLQLLYKAIFETAKSRTQFLSLLLGRPYHESADPGPGASVDQVIAAVEKSPPDRALYERTHTALVVRITRDDGVTLDAADRATLDKTHRAFFKGQLDLAFKLKPPNGRQYPSLRQLLETRAPGGTQLGFLASSAEFRVVRKLELENRIIPVVGDFAGTHALAAVGKELSRRHLVVGAFYVSNVEQYVMSPPQWAAWTRNVKALPTDKQSLFIRCYLDQGRAHPLQLKGQRTTTVLQSIRHFEAHAGGYRTFFQVATDDVLQN